MIADLASGSTFGPYRIVDTIGRGGMSAVYKAYDQDLDRHVALKVLPGEYLHDPDFAQRFRREARIAARLEHPNVVPIHAFGVDQGRPWMALRLVAGGTLADRMSRGPVPAETALAVLRDIADALDYAHANGVVHRDVKPQNVLLDERGRALLADFGIARALEASTVMTATGVIHGTPSYMAPEQATGQPLDLRCDVYSLGVVAFECLTGRVPFSGSTPVAVLMQHVSEPVPEPAGVPGPVTLVLRRCLAKAPDERWSSAGAFVQALAAASRDAMPRGVAPATALLSPAPSSDRAAAAAPPATPRSSRVGWRAAAAGLMLLAAGVLLGRLVQQRPEPSSPGKALSSSPSPEATTTPPSTPAVAPPVSRSPRPPSSRRRAPPAAGAPAAGAPTTAPPRALETVVPSPDLAADPAPAADGDAGTAAVVPARSARDRIRVFCEAQPEPRRFRKPDPEGVRDSVADLKRALAKRAGLELVADRGRADVVLLVLERGRVPPVFGMRKVRVRAIAGDAVVDVMGQDGLTGTNSWSGAAQGALRQVEEWLNARGAGGRED